MVMSSKVPWGTIVMATELDEYGEKESGLDPTPKILAVMEPDLTGGRYEATIQTKIDKRISNITEKPNK